MNESSTNGNPDSVVLELTEMGQHGFTVNGYVDVTENPAAKDALQDVFVEMQRQLSLGYRQFNSNHEFFGVLWEEFEEVGDEIRRNVHDTEAIRKEVIQIAAVCARFVQELDEKVANGRNNQIGSE